MRKTAIMLLLIASISLIFAGAVSAEPYVEVAVLDENDDLVEVATEGDEVELGTYVDTDEELDLPFVIVDMDPEIGLTLEVASAKMTIDGINWIYNDPYEPFFFWYAPDYVFVWDIHKITGDMQAGDAAELRVPGMVSATGEITVFADLYEHEEDGSDEWVAGDSYSFLALPGPEPVPIAAGTVPMQTTGSPIALLVLAILSIISGTVYGKFR